MTNGDSDLVVLLENPRVTADFSKMTVGDYLELNKDNGYILRLLEKLTVEDLSLVPFDHLPAILQRLAEEMKNMLTDLVTARDFLNG